MKKLKVLTIVGTRPEIIRLSRTIALLDRHVNHILVHTGQNYDYELNEIFFKDLEIRKPDHFLNIDTSSLGAAVGDIMRKSEEVLRKEMPDAMLVLGDTNSCLAAYMAKRMHIPIFHMEAGNRSFDFNVPEEVNRRIIDHIADFNLVYTEHARRHLISEGLPHRRIYLTGSPMKEVLDYYKSKIENRKSKIENDFFLVSVHREENVDNPENLKKILFILNQVAEKYQLPVIVSTHPRTRKRLEAGGQVVGWSGDQVVGRSGDQVVGWSGDQVVGWSGDQVVGWSGDQEKSTIDNRQSTIDNPLIHFMKPFGFLDYIHLQQHAKCVISDSGTISEESAILGFPAISLRQSMERPEAQDAGTIILTGFDPDIVLQSIETVISEFEHLTSNRPIAKSSNRQIAQSPNRQIPEAYQVTDTSWRVLKLIMGNARLSNKWWGINQ